MIDQFDDEIKLTVIDARRKNLHDMRMINGCGGASFLLETASFSGIGAQFLSQNFQRDHPFQTRVSRFVN